MEEATKKQLAENIGKVADMVIDPIKQRTAHPFISSYLIAWLFVNIKAFLCLIFSAKEIEEKFIYIEKTIYPDFWSRANGILIPLIIALIYTVGLKWIDRLIDILNEKPIKARIKNQAKIKIDTLESEIDIVEMQIRLNNARAENKELQELNDKITSLNKEVEIRDTTIEAITSETQNLRSELNSLMQDYSDLKDENAVITHKSINSTNFEKNLESLIKALFAELDREQFTHILSKISDTGVPDHILKMADEAYKEKEKFSLHVYRIELPDDFNNTELELLKGDFALINSNIEAKIINMESNGIVTRKLEVIYRSNIPAKEIRLIVKRKVPIIKRG
ncbi:hypothetical protein [Sphingobacterium multivorum]|uniref:hypothetical protein n=1 Tax=Sphingobacterium multivorum TaxID=28454 RepID=UPI0028A0D4D3|nr:hypothetical protein [Sphingobacterium multivorum]